MDEDLGGGVDVCRCALTPALLATSPSPSLRQIAILSIRFKPMATFESIQSGNIHIDQGDRTAKNLSPLALDRVQYNPRYPECLESPEKIVVSHSDGDLTV